MSSKRKIRRDACSKKVKLDQPEALRRAVLNRRKTGDSWNAYPCPYCGGWHIGHTPYKVRQAIVAKRNRKAEK